MRRILTKQVKGILGKDNYAETGSLPKDTVLERRRNKVGIHWLVIGGDGDHEGWVFVPDRPLELHSQVYRNS